MLASSFFPSAPVAVQLPADDLLEQFDDARRDGAEFSDLRRVIVGLGFQPANPSVKELLLLGDASLEVADEFRLNEQ